jgi:hypothetical protein
MSLYCAIQSAVRIFASESFSGVDGLAQDRQRNTNIKSGGLVDLVVEKMTRCQPNLSLAKI